MDILKTSFSALETFKQCALKYKYQNIDRIRAPKSKEAVFGQKIHKALQYFHSKTPVSPTLDELLNHIKEIWDNEPFLDEQEEMIYFGEAVKILKNYYNHFSKLQKKPIVLDTETRFEIILESKGEKCRLAGIVDRIDKLDNGIEIVDYKTTKRLPAQKEIDDSLQLSLYCLGLKERWPHYFKNLNDIKLTFSFLKHQETLTTKRTQEQLDLVEKEVWERLRKIGKSKFEPTPSPLCDWCGYKKMCPMWKHLYKEQATLDDQQAEKVVNEYLELKEQNSSNNKKIGELRGIIEEYLEKQELGRVFGESGYITRSIQKRGGYDLKKLQEIIKTLPQPIQEELEKAKRPEKEFTTLKVGRKKIDKKEK